MTLVVDASAVVAALVDSAADGRWVIAQFGHDRLTAPQILIAEAANVLRRAQLAGTLSSDAATLAYADLLALPVELFPYEPFADRVWELRTTLTIYDGWYVAIAEDLDATFVTLDRRLSRAPGLRCAFRLPPASRSASDG